MNIKQRRPAPLGDRPPEHIEAGELDGANFNHNQVNFQAIGDIAALIIARIAKRHGLTLSTASTVCTLAGIGGGQ